MFTKLIAKLTLSVLRRTDLSMSDRMLLTTMLFDKIGALPLRDMIRVNEEGRLLVNGRLVGVEAARKLRESARAELNSYARKFISEQVLYTAVVMGVHKMETPEQSVFSRAAIWYKQQEDIWLNLLGGQVDEESE